MSNSDQTFRKERLEQLEEFNRAINEMNQRLRNIESKIDDVRQQALSSVAPQIKELQDNKLTLINRVQQLRNEKENYYQNTCGHLEYNDGTVHMCLWCGKDL